MEVWLFCLVCLRGYLCGYSGLYRQNFWWVWFYWLSYFGFEFGVEWLVLFCLFELIGVLVVMVFGLGLRLPGLDLVLLIVMFVV